MAAFRARIRKLAEHLGNRKKMRIATELAELERSRAYYETIDRTLDDISRVRGGTIKVTHSEAREIRDRDREKLGRDLKNAGSTGLVGFLRRASIPPGKRKLLKAMKNARVRKEQGGK